MRYGEPDVLHAFRELERKCLYSMRWWSFHSSPLCPVDNRNHERGNRAYLFSRPHSFRLRFVEPYYNHPAFIEALTNQARPYLEGIDKLVFTYHSLPVTQVAAAWRKGKEFDYVYQLKETNHLFCQATGIDPHDTFLFYSSQRGRKWLNHF